MSSMATLRKRPMSAYLFWWLVPGHARPAQVQSSGHGRRTDALQGCNEGEQWRELDAASKEKYCKLADDDRKRFEMEPSRPVKASACDPNGLYLFTHLHVERRWAQRHFAVCDSVEAAEAACREKAKSTLWAGADDMDVNGMC